MIKNIVVDIGGVLAVGRSISSLEELNLDIDTYNELSVFFEGVEKLDLGEQTLLEKYNECHFKDDKYKEYLLEYYKHRQFDMDLIKAMKALKSIGYKIYVLSDNNNEVYNYLKHLELFSFVDHFVMSCEYHAIKEDGGLFKVLIEKYNVNPEECYFIDDKIENVSVSRNLGMKGYVFDNDTIMLWEDLKKFNVVDKELIDMIK